MVSLKLRVASRAGLACLVLCLTGCGYFDSRTVHKAQLAMIGMTENDLHSCVGIPDKTLKMNATTVLEQYIYKPNTPGTFSIAPLNMGTVTYNGSGSACVMMIRIDRGQVSEVHFAGDNDRLIGHEGICEPVIRGCVRQPESTMRHVSGGLFGPVSAFSSPPIPPQSQSAVWNGPAADLPALRTPADQIAGGAAKAAAASRAAAPSAPVVSAGEAVIERSDAASQK